VATSGSRIETIDPRLDQALRSTCPRPVAPL
jgi:hypothetical protein